MKKSSSFSMDDHDSNQRSDIITSSPKITRSKVNVIPRHDFKGSMHDSSNISCHNDPKIEKESIFAACLRCFSFRRKSLREYQILLIFTLLFNIFAILAELSSDFGILGQGPFNASTVYDLLAIAAVILASLNCCAILRLIFKPTTNLSLCTFAIVVILEAVYITQIVLSYYVPTCVYDEDNTDDVTDVKNTSPEVLVYNVCFIFIQLLTAILLYRYWEFVLYNYDGSVSEVSSLRSSLLTDRDSMNPKSPPIEDNNIDVV